MAGELELEVGDRLLVAENVDGDWTGDWFEVGVKSISVLHNPRPNGELDPYVCVGVGHKTLSCFNYSLYCLRGKVKHLEPEGIR